MAVSGTSHSAPITVRPPANRNAAIAGQNVTLLARVSLVAPGTGTPTGTVTFSDNGTTLGTAAIAADGSASLVTQLGLGSHSLTAAYSGGSAFVASQSSPTSVTINPPPPVVISITEQIVVADSPAIVTGNTPTGADIVVSPTDPRTGTSPVTLTFSNVVQTGVTSVTSSSTGLPIPNGFKLGSPSVYFDITSTAVFTGPVTVCFSYAGIYFRNVAALQLLHYESGAWVNRTVSANTATQQVCARVTSFSPFTIVEPVNRAPVLSNPGDQTSPE